MRIGALARVYLSPEPDIWRPRCLYIHLARVSLYLVRERCAPSWQFQSRGRRTGARSQLLGPRYLDSRYILRFSLKSSQPGSLSLSRWRSCRRPRCLTFFSLRFLLLSSCAESFHSRTRARFSWAHKPRKKKKQVSKSGEIMRKENL